MKSIDDKSNQRLLVIDDEEAIRDSFKLVLCPTHEATDQLDAAAAALFGDAPELAAAPPKATETQFQVDFATNGREGLDFVEKSIADDRPYAVVFCDMRMPGWDGLETIEHIRKVDPRCEIVFVTAYSDQNVESIVNTVGADVGYFLKPFANEELRQMAIKGVLEWNRARELERLLTTVTSLRGEVDDIDRLLRYLLKQLCDWLGTESAALIRLSDDGEHIVRLGVGRLTEDQVNQKMVHDVAATCGDRPCQSDEGITYLPIKEYGLAVAVDCENKLTPDKEYLLRFFLEHASMAIRNSEMQSELLKTEKLAAVGQAIGYIVHDLRNPLGNIKDLVNALDDPDEYGLTPEEIREFMGRALATTTNLLNDTLEFSRGSVTTNLERVTGSWAELMQPNLELMRLDLNKLNVKLIVDAPADLQLHVDAARLFRAIRNLCKNAGEALKSTGHSDGQVTVGARADSGFTQFWVADNGAGIPEEVKAKLFQPFATMGKTGGTGFGLAIVKQLIEAHQGTIEVDSDDTGTKFTIKIPDSV